MLKNQQKYTLKDLGYNKHLTKEDDFYNETPQVKTSVENEVPTVLIGSGGTTGNMEIVEGYIQSSNFESGSAGWQLSPTSCEINVSTSILNLDIPDTSTANSFHVESDGDTFWGCTPSDFTSDNDNADAYVLKTGVAKFQNVAIDGGSNVYFISDTFDTSNKKILKDFTFESTDYAGAFKTGNVAWNTSTGRITSGTGVLISDKGIMLASSGSEKITMLTDGTVAIEGSITVTGGDALKYSSGAKQSDGTAIDADDINDGSTNRLVTTNEKTGASRAYSGLNSDDRLITAVIPGDAASALAPTSIGLYVTSDFLGYYDGTDPYASSGWDVYIDSSGQFKFGGDASNYVQWDGSNLDVRGRINADDIYTGTLTGRNVRSASSGARVEIFPDANTGIQVIDDGGSDVFKALVGGTDVGDVIIGNYSGGQGLKYDKSAGTIYYKNLAWSEVVDDDSNKPANNATVGATFGTDISGGGSGDNQVGNDGYVDVITAGIVKADTTFTNNLNVKSTFTIGDSITDGIIQSYGWDGSVDGFKILGGSTPSIELIGGTIIGSTIKTASSPNDRIELYSNNLISIDASNNQRFDIVEEWTRWFGGSPLAEQGYIATNLTDNAIYFKSVVADMEIHATNGDMYLVTDKVYIGDKINPHQKTYLHIKGSSTSTDEPGLLVLYDHAGNDYYLWVDRNGKLRIHTSDPTDEDVDGVIVGTQT